MKGGVTKQNFKNGCPLPVVDSQKNFLRKAGPGGRKIPPRPQRDCPNGVMKTVLSHGPAKDQEGKSQNRTLPKLTKSRLGGGMEYGTEKRPERRGGHDKFPSGGKHRSRALSSDDDLQNPGNPNKQGRRIITKEKRIRTLHSLQGGRKKDVRRTERSHENNRRTKDNHLQKGGKNQRES